MKCAICKSGETRPGAATATVQRGDTTVDLKHVPADVCESCGEYYLSAEVTAQVLEKAASASKSGAEVEILGFAHRA